MAVIHFIDTFTGASNTDISSHTPDQSTQTDQYYSAAASTVKLDGNGTVMGNQAATEGAAWLYYWRPTGTDSNQQITLNNLTLVGNVGVVARAMSASQWYSVLYDAGAGGWKWLKTNGSATQVGSTVSYTLPSGLSTYTIQFRTVNSGADVQATILDSTGTQIAQWTETGAAPVGGTAPYTNPTTGYGISVTGSMTSSTGVHIDRVEFYDPMTATLSGPTSGTQNSDSTNFTLTISDIAPQGGLTFQLTASSGMVYKVAGSAVTSYTVAAGATTGTFVVNASDTAAHAVQPVRPNVPVTPSSITYTAGGGTPTQVTLSGPTSGYKGEDSTNFTLTLDNPAPTGGTTVNFTASTNMVYKVGGSAVTSTVIAAGQTTKTFVVNASDVGNHSVAVTSTGLSVVGSPITYNSQQEGMTISPGTLPTNQSTAVTFTGIGTLWNTTAPTITVSGVSGVSVTGLTVTDNTHATATVVCGANTGTVTFTDTTTGATCTGLVANIVNITKSVCGFNAANYQLYDSSGSAVGGVVTTGILHIGSFNGISNSAVRLSIAPGTVSFIMWTDAAGNNFIDDVPPFFPTAQLDLSQNIPFSDLSAKTTQSLGDCLSAARAQGIGKWVMNTSTKTLTVYGPDGTTVVRTFTLDAVPNPSQRA